MPLANGNLEQRIGLYKGNMDAVLRVAIQLTDALIAAHAREFSRSRSAMRSPIRS